MIQLSVMLTMFVRLLLAMHHVTQLNAIRLKCKEASNEEHMQTSVLNTKMFMIQCFYASFVALVFVYLFLFL